ncbi:13120_t:CDS:2 [Ambispora gerdemannii]|uniref:13120_t:CDS:1 n=1 Tax=Ambispora gerdemannii TaxID=144530 RepID=A0A9N9A0E0_9GLOM|nr:13120_t:CDS:2 [Ambispora gerdemannii]
MAIAVKEALKDLKGRLEDKVAIITGAGGGIGFEACVLFAKEGARVVAADIELKAAEKAVDRVKDVIGPLHLSKHAIAYKVDVTKEAEVKKMVETALREFGRLDIMFNNAGIMHPHDDNALSTDEKVWDLTFETNVKSVWFGSKYAIEAFRRNGKGGNIINTASFVASVGAATPQLAYTASKGAVLALSRELAVTHARENVRVNTISPGPLNTPLLQNFLNTDDKKQRRLVHIPMGRFGEPIEIAQTALFLASDEASYITGADFKVDGGVTSAYVTPEGATKSVAPKNWNKGDKKASQ